jgi:hypothetical protein
LWIFITIISATECSRLSLVGDGQQFCELGARLSKAEFVQESA